jgi:release factor glutamine methyltransferase
MTTIWDALRAATHLLEAASPSARLDAEILLGHTLKLGRAALLAESRRELSASEIDAYQEFVLRRAALEPLHTSQDRKSFTG